MKKITRSFLLLPLFSLMTTAAVAAPNPEVQGDTGTLTGELPPTVKTQVEGYVELRPSWVPNDSAARLENNAYVGARFANGWLLAYRQEFASDLAGGDGKEFNLGDGWVEYSAYPALQKGPFTLNAEFHGLLPVAGAASETNFVTGLRTYMEGIVAFMPRIGLFSRLMPRWNVFGAGAFAQERVLFENQLELGPYVTFFADRLTVRLLARWTAGHLQANNGDAPRWENQLQLTPEVLYQLNPNIVLGVAQCSGSMVEGDFGGKAEALSTAFRESTWQFIVQVTL